MTGGRPVSGQLKVEAALGFRQGSEQADWHAAYKPL
jgi:hypothetical protein